MTRPSRVALLLTAAGAAAGFAVWVAATGGIDARVAGIPVRSRSWERPAVLALLLATLAGVDSRREVGAVLRHGGVLHRGARVLAWIAAGWAVLAAVVFGTFAAGGADSYGYVGQAELLSRGHLVDVLPEDPAFSWEGAASTLAPLGFGADETRGRLIPLYPPGLPLLMAPLATLDARAVFLVVPLSAGLLVWLCWRLGERLGSRSAGALGAVLLSVSPTFLYQAMQPMSDVPVAACWMAALLLASAPGPWTAGASGAAGSLAVLIRPNLAPLLLLVTGAALAGTERVTWKRAAVCAAASLPGLMALGAIQHVRYGSPFASGYGRFSELFATAHIIPNLMRYPKWLIMAHTPFILLWVLAPVWFIRREPRVRRLGWICYLFSWAVVLAYLPYVHFQSHEWAYTRFLLPALPIMLVFGAGLFLETLRRVLGRWAAAVSLLIATGLCVFSVTTARTLSVFRLRDGEQKYPATGAFVRDNLPANAVIFAMQHGGSLRYYAGRMTVRWDLLDPGALESAVAALEAGGYVPFLVLDPDEEVRFHARFMAEAPEVISALAPVGRIRGTRVYAFSPDAVRPATRVR